jgi:GTP-binding protein Era
MVDQPVSIPYKSGFSAVVGRPNVGKSQLINLLLGQKIAAVSSKPQTTRRQQLGILSLNGAQIILVDTPGIHLPHHLLGEQLNLEAAHAILDSDLILWIVDGSVGPHADDEQVAERIRQEGREAETILVINKLDLLPETGLPEREGEYRALLQPATAVAISALSGINIDRLLEELLRRLPDGEPFFPEDQLTDAFERDIAADLIREAALRHLFGEVPHSIAVRIDEFTERGKFGAFIAATLFVERESQKAIVIGEGGSMIKAIGVTAREEIEAMSGRKVFLDLKVKTRKNWRNDKNALTAFGFRTDQP